MARYFIEDSTLQGIADAIRSKTGESEPIDVSDFAEKIKGISAGGGSTPEKPTYNGVMPLGKYKVITVDGDVSIAIGNGIDAFFTYENDGVVVTQGGTIEFWDGELWFFEPEGEYDKAATVGDVIEVTYEQPVSEEQFDAFFHYFAPL